LILGMDEAVNEEVLSTAAKFMGAAASTASIDRRPSEAMKT